MKTKNIVLALLLLPSLFFAQVGIGTTTPDASAKLEVKATDKGFLIPRMTSVQRLAIVTPVSGLQVYDNQTNSIWYFNGNVWVNMLENAIVGDIKSGVQIADHNGWIKLDGRLKSTLTATQQVWATAFGFGTNLPDATNAVLMQNNSGIGSVSGSNTKTIAQTNLPNIDYTGSIINLAHGLNVGSSSSGVFTRENGSDWGNAAGGGSTEKFNFSLKLNGGVTQTPLDVTPKSLSVNMFIYLGL